MKALVKTARARGHVELMEVERPEPRRGEVLVRIHAASVCGSDLHAYQYDASYAFMTVPVILGHELSGVVEAVGEGVAGVKPGDRVIAEANLACGECVYCKAGDSHICENFKVQGLHVNGGFAEFFRTGEHSVHRIPDALDLQLAALTEPLAVVVHAIRDRSHIRPGEYAAVFGPGPIGILAALVIATAGATPILFGIGDDEQVRLPAARSLGIRACNLSVQSAEDVLRELGRNAFDHVVDCSGSAAALETGLGVLKKGGQATLVGLFPGPSTLDLSRVVRREIRIVGSYACKRSNYLQAIELLTNRTIDVEPLMAPYRLEQHEAAFGDALTKRVIKPVFLLQ